MIHDNRKRPNNKDRLFSKMSYIAVQTVKLCQVRRRFKCNPGYFIELQCFQLSFIESNQQTPVEICVYSPQVFIIWVIVMQLNSKLVNWPCIISAPYRGEL